MRRLFALALIPTALGAQATTSDPLAASRADTALRVVVSLGQRRLWVVRGANDTLLAARVAVGSGKTLSTSTRTWTFRTPRGVHTVLAKEVDPVWVRPDWSYIEVARTHKLGLEYLDARKPRVLSDSSSLVVRDRVVYLVTGERASPLPMDEEIVFDGTLFVPPIDSRQRGVSGQLGAYRLNLRNGIGLHGTPDTASIGRAVTHGCLRLADDDLEWVFQNVGVGTRVYIF